VTAAVEEIQLDQYIGKRVVVVRNVNGENGPEAVEIEGYVETANAKGVLLKPKGKTQFDLIEADEIEKIDLAPEDTKLKARRINPVKLGQAKNHLLERHGYTLTQVNDMTEQEAFEFHLSLDHKAEDLGHYHAEKPAKKDDDSED
jgi:hypothetical protein